MNELVKAKTLTSLEVCEMIGKSHAHLCRDIAKYVGALTQTKNGFSEFFKKSSYKDSSGKKNVKDYVALAEAQGHHGSAKFAYSNITKLVKKPFGEREGASSGTLAMIATTEHILGNTLSQMVNAGADAKEAYRKLKEKAGRLSVALLEA